MGTQCFLFAAILVVFRFLYGNRFSAFLVKILHFRTSFCLCGSSSIILLSIRNICVYTFHIVFAYSFVKEDFKYRNTEVQKLSSLCKFLLFIFVQKIILWFYKSINKLEKLYLKLQIQRINAKYPTSEGGPTKYAKTNVDTIYRNLPKPRRFIFLIIAVRLNRTSAKI